MNNKTSKTGKCSRCKVTTLLSRYTSRNMWGDLFNRWLCLSCATSKGFVTTQFNA
jgi:hypothetical protein